MIIDLTLDRDGAGPARLLDMVEGRSKAAFKTAAAEEVPDAVTVMDPFHVVRLAGDAHVEVEAARGVYQRMIAAYRHEDRQRADRGAQRTARTPARLRTRVPQLDQLHRPKPARDRRLQTPTPTPSIGMSQKHGRCLWILVC